MPQLRQNIITGDWVVIAPERAKRPQDFIVPRSRKETNRESCPFCIGTDRYKDNIRVPKVSTEHVFVVENRYPAFIENEIRQSTRSFYPESGFYRARASVGDHEVVVVKEHDLSLMTFPKVITKELFEVIRDRYIWMKDHEEVASIMPIYNHGPEAGASIDHPHAQIFASGIVANMVGKEMDGAERYYGINGACVYCDIVAHEVQQKTRVVYQNDRFLAINFVASRFPFETWILPKRHESQFELISDHGLIEFADALTETMAMLNHTLENPPLNWYLHTLPVIHQDSASYHWHLEIVPRITNYGGFEMGSEVVINVMPPEEATHYLRTAHAPAGKQLDVHSH